MRRILAVAAMAAMAVLTGCGTQATTPVHNPARPCSVRDWGNTNESGGHWFICQPAGHGRFTWQPLPGRQEAS